LSLRRGQSRDAGAKPGFSSATVEVSWEWFARIT
jgi:hypothetical protein